eukprot:15032963-Ditylum_brightwellii.AAC.1
MKKANGSLLLKKSNAVAASNLLDSELNNLYQRVIPNNLKFDTVPSPRRAKSRAAQAVRSYAEILMGLVNPQDDTSGYNTNPIRSQKRVAVEIDMSTEDNPINITTGKQSNQVKDINNNMVTMEILEQK